jgi:hypothetical protein
VAELAQASANGDAAMSGWFAHRQVPPMSASEPSSRTLTVRPARALDRRSRGDAECSGPSRAPGAGRGRRRSGSMRGRTGSRRRRGEAIRAARARRIVCVVAAFEEGGLRWRTRLEVSSTTT